MQRVVVRQVAHDHVTVTRNDSEQIVEVVRDTAGKAPDGLHFLRLTELIFQLPAFGNVDPDAADELDFVVFVQNGKPVDQPVMHGVLVRHRVDGLHECLGADHLAIVGHEANRSQWKTIADAGDR